MAASALADTTLAATTLATSWIARPREAPYQIWWPWRSPFGDSGRRYIAPPYTAPALLSAAAGRREVPLAAAAWSWLAIYIPLYPLSAF